MLSSDRVEETAVTSNQLSGSLEERCADPQASLPWISHKGVMSVTSTLCADVPWLFRSLVYIILHPLTSEHIIRGLKNHRESSACFFNPSPTWRRHTLQSAAGFDLDWTDWIAPQYILTKDITDDFLSRNMVSELKTTGKVSRKRGLSTSGPLHFWFDLIQVYTIRLKLGWMLSLSCSPDRWHCKRR